MYQDRGLGATGAAAYCMDGLHIFRKLSLLLYDQDVNEFLPAGDVLEEIVYKINENGSLERCGR